MAAIRNQEGLSNDFSDLYLGPNKEEFLEKGKRSKSWGEPPELFLLCSLYVRRDFHVELST
jgi:hypothetical protein